MKGSNIVLLILLVTNTMMVTIKCKPDTNVTAVLCNSGTYTTGDPFGASLAYVLDELETDTPGSESHDLYNISPYPNAFAYGHGSCSENLTTLDCAACLVDARLAMLGSCQSRIGARGVLRDCEIRYEQYPFTE